MIVEVLFGVGKDLFGIFSKFGEKKLSRAIRIADYFAGLAQTIEDTSAYLKKGVYPHGECAQLRFYADKMEDTIGDLVDDAAKYAAEVKQVWEIERLHGELLSAPAAEREQKLHKLDEAAGYFRAIAAHLRVST